MWLCSLARPQPLTQVGKEGKKGSGSKEAQPFREPQESSSDSFTRDQAAALTSIPEKIFRMDDLVILKLFQIALKEQSLGQPMGGMNGIQFSVQFPAGKRPTVPGSQPCGPANVCRTLPPWSHVTMVKDFERKGGDGNIFKEG